MQTVRKDKANCCTHTAHFRFTSSMLFYVKYRRFHSIIIEQLILRLRTSQPRLTYQPAINRNKVKLIDVIEYTT